MQNEKKQFNNKTFSVRLQRGYFMLMNEQFDVNGVGCTGKTLLITLCRTTATENEKLCLIKYLLNAGADVSCKDKFGRTITLRGMS